MTWAKLDDRFHEHRKVKRAWRVEPAAVGLHVMAITYCSGHETDGLVDLEFVEEKIPAERARTRVINALVDAGMWIAEENGWKLHDYLEYNPSRADLDLKRSKDAERKAKGRESAAARRAAETVPSSSGARPRGLFADTTRNPDGVGAASSGPDPTRPDPYPPNPPQGELPPLPIKPGGNRARGLAAFEEQCRSYAAAAFPGLDPVTATQAISVAISWTGRTEPATHESVAAYVRQHTNWEAT